MLVLLACTEPDPKPTPDVGGDDTATDTGTPPADPTLTYRSEVALAWGRTVEGEGTTVAIGGGSTVLLIDASDPSAPVEIGRVEDLGEISDVELSNGVLYVASDTQQTGDEISVRVFDVADPASPALLTTLGPPVDNAHTLTANDAGLLAMTSTYNMTYAIYDVTDPATPTRLSNWTPHGQAGPHDMTFAGDRLWVAYTSGWACLDLSDPAAPVALFEQEADWDEPFVHNLGVSDDGAVVAMSEEAVGGRMRVYDVADLDAVALAGEYQTDPLHTIHTVIMRGNTAFAAWFLDGLLVFDLTDPSATTPVAQYDTYTTGEEGLQEDGRWMVAGAASVWVEGELVAVADSHRGLILLTWGP